MAFATAKFWGIEPHAIWRYAFRYYKELRDFYVASLSVATVVTQRGSSQPNDVGDVWAEESFRGDAI